MQAQAADADLVRSAQGGDRSSFGELYNRHRRLVHGILLSRVPHGEAEDLLQIVFLRALKTIDSLREAESFGAWLGAITRNVAADFYRRSGAATTIHEVDRLPTRARQTDEADSILSVIRGLPAAYSETLVLRLVEGMTGPEIAEQTGLSPDSVRVNLCRGMKRLREELKTGKKNG